MTRPTKIDFPHIFKVLGSYRMDEYFFRSYHDAELYLQSCLPDKKYAIIGMTYRTSDSGIPLLKLDYWKVMKRDNELEKEYCPQQPTPIEKLPNYAPEYTVYFIYGMDIPQKYLCGIATHISDFVHYFLYR